MLFGHVARIDKNTPAQCALKLSLTSEGVHTFTLPSIALGLPQRFAGLSQISELHSAMPGMVPSTVITLTGTMVLSRLCTFDDDDEFL